MNHRAGHVTWFGIAGSRAAIRLLIFAVPIVIARAAFAQLGSQDAWQNVSQCTDKIDVEMFIAEFPNSEFVEKARDCLAKLGDSRSVSPAGSDARTRSGGMNDPIQVGMEARITELQAENREKDRLLEEAHALLAVSDSDLQSARDKILVLESDLGQTHEDLASSLRVISSLEASLSDTRADKGQSCDGVTALESGLKVARHEVLEVRSRMAALETLLVSARTQLASSRQSENALEVDLIRTRNGLEASQSLVEELEEQLEATRRELSAIRTNPEKTCEALPGRPDKLSMAQLEADEVRQELAAVRDSHASALIELETIHSAYSLSQADLEVALMLLAAAREEAAYSNSRLTAANAELEQSRIELEAAWDELASVRSEFFLSLAELESTLDELGKVRDELTSTLSLLANTRIDLLRAREELSDVRAGARSSQDHVESLPATLSERGSELAAAQSKIASKDNEIFELRRRLVALEDELVALSREVRSLTTDLADRETALAAAVEERDRIRQTTGLTQEELRRALQNLDEAERARLAEAASAELLRRRLQDSEAELTAMTLVLENERKEAEEVIAQLAESRSAADRYAEVRAISEDRAQQILLLNRQIIELREQLRELDAFVVDAVARDVASEVEIAILSRELDQALARAAAEQKKRADLEERERWQLEAGAQDLRLFHSKFLAQLQDVLGGREGVRIVGDRFVFSSEILFEVGSDVLGDTGKEEIRRVSEIIKDVAQQIPPEVDWILRVDGHTDNTPVRANPWFRDNWQLSSARALSVVRYMIDELGIPANRLAANGFGEHQPIAVGDDQISLAQNRRIEIKFTER